MSMPRGFDETYLVTGAAGFIGFHLCRRLLAEGAKRIIGVDNLYRDENINLKRARLARLLRQPNFRFAETGVCRRRAIDKLFAEETPAVVAHLAARTGVRHALSQSRSVAETNIGGFINILEACRRHPPRHLLYASSSSVYGDMAGANECARPPAPLSIYAATKISNEHTAEIYARQAGVASTGMRFFTVYGPWGRRDMAVFKFAEQIAGGHALTVVNDGATRRRFTYIDDVIESIMRLTALPPESSRVVNIGAGESHTLNELITLLENNLAQKTNRIEYCAPVSSDAAATIADCRLLHELTGFRPSVSLQEGIKRFCVFYNQWKDDPSRLR